MVSGCQITPLFDALAAFHEAHPGVEVALVEDDSSRLVEGVQGGRLDVALVATAGPPPEELSSVMILREGLVAAVPDGHPLAGRTRLRLVDLVRHPLVCLPPGTGIRTVLDQACASAGLAPTVALEASAPDAVADLAARGLGVAVLTPATVEGHDDLHVVAISGVDLPAVLALVWPPTASPAGAALVRCCEDTFGLAA
jgi:DNA-binding transcriptional LysR family regulator